ncbi:VOC family protein [Streptomyces sp. NPDC021224]|uniref:VOC family protein n=1 Tax=unclassified Streptomyces TaxID=2593676 RepID=UPI0037B83AE3
MTRPAPARTPPGDTPRTAARGAIGPSLPPAILDTLRGRPQRLPDTPRMARHGWWGVVLEAPDPAALARFYVRVLGWRIDKEEPDWVAIAPEEGVAYLAFQRSADYVPPVRPARDGAPRITMHLDFEVTDLDAAVADALSLGAPRGPPAPARRPRPPRPRGPPLLPLPRGLSPAPGPEPRAHASRRSRNSRTRSRRR